MRARAILAHKLGKTESELDFNNLESEIQSDNKANFDNAFKIAESMKPDIDYTRAQLSSMANLTIHEAISGIHEAIERGLIKEVVKKKLDGQGIAYVQQGGRYVLTDKFSETQLLLSDNNTNTIESIISSQPPDESPEEYHERVRKHFTGEKYDHNLELDLKTSGHEEVSKQAAGRHNDRIKHNINRPMTAACKDYLESILSTVECHSKC